MKYDVRLTIGHDVGGAPAWDTPAVAERVERYLKIDGYTAIPCTGMWRGRAEQSTRIEISALGEREARRVASLVPALAAALGQEAIMQEVAPSRAEFVAARAAAPAEAV